MAADRLPWLPAISRDETRAAKRNSFVGLAPPRVSRYDTRHVDIYESTRKNDVSDGDILDAINFALAAAEQDDGKVLDLGPDKSGNLFEVVAVRRDDATEIAIHAMKMRRMYEPLLREMGGTDD